MRSLIYMIQNRRDFGEQSSQRRHDHLFGEDQSPEHQHQQDATTPSKAASLVDKRQARIEKWQTRPAYTAPCPLK